MLSIQRNDTKRQKLMVLCIVDVGNIHVLVDIPSRTITYTIYSYAYPNSLVCLFLRSPLEFCFCTCAHWSTRERHVHTAFATFDKGYETTLVSIAQTEESACENTLSAALHPGHLVKCT